MNKEIISQVVTAIHFCVVFGEQSKQLNTPTNRKRSKGIIGIGVEDNAINSVPKIAAMRRKRLIQNESNTWPTIAKNQNALPEKNASPLAIWNAIGFIK